MHNEVQYLSSCSWAVDRSALENTIKSVSQRAWGPQGGEDSDLMSKAYHLSQDCRAVTLQTAAPRPQGAERLGTIWARCSPWLCGQETLHTLSTQPRSDKWDLCVLAHSPNQPQHFLCDAWWPTAEGRHPAQNKVLEGCVLDPYTFCQEASGKYYYWPKHLP